MIGAVASAKPVKRTATSKTLVANNLPVSIDKSHVIGFFTQVGDDIVDVRLYHYNGKDGKLKKPADKAIKFQRLEFLGYTAKLSRQLEEGAGASKRLVMKGLPYYTDKSDVINFFKQAGEIVDVHL
ncbi:hypothetical protein MKX01_023409 [Papaver californicum]|nr:hypothetical protein MKX01_023409 [Papaver californicum]